MRNSAEKPRELGERIAAATFRNGGFQPPNADEAMAIDLQSAVVL